MRAMRIAAVLAAAASLACARTTTATAWAATSCSTARGSTVRRDPLSGDVDLAGDGTGAPGDFAAE
jgi:hypothetical protein